jgi:hypothetical protein
MHELSITDINFHDAQLLDLEYFRNEQRIEVSISSFLEKDKKAALVRLDFQGISFFLFTNLQPWGPSPYINQAILIDQLPCGPWKLLQGDRLLHIQMQSGDDMFIGYNTVLVNENN